MAADGTDSTDIPFERIPHPAPVPGATRDQALADPGFGSLFSDHMVQIDWTEGRGWHSHRVGPREPIALDPATSVLHYAQEIFEGMKAYRQDNGDIALFRPEANAARFNNSGARLAMPPIPEADFLAAVREQVLADRDWFPSVEGGSLYLRPFMFASEAFLGVRPAKEYKFLVIASPVGGYFKSGAPAVSIWVSEDYIRAAPGGTGDAKCGGNYAASLVPQAEAIANGYDQVVFLDAVERKWVEELGGMNLFFVFDDGRILTPPLTGTILPGITRDSLITLAREEGLDVVEERYSLEQWREDAQSGKLLETMACGTAAVVTPVGKVGGRDGEFIIGGGRAGQMAARLREKLVGIQRGTIEDRHGWVTRIG
ncbi:branched-chain amino acid aminotransferase [Alteriqipengyuania flavescens]|uniref:branched-chain amino acid aminotransferase n=1 Tax=Alteriqipengyuania flavescens TaxID=3053610 RepID=UPI0025B4A373|nr:branched-chain amino acid aminotransferase [Alteriqipengyuania flavescens]WJY18847.1 branched-chain amino acid aminotransferase [Alteriqipengyuania flavescens]WJY24787.1 branched-chain amino acid aminotransferase [Alteriqipengyuania flavescens]